MKTKQFIVEVYYHLLDGEDHDQVGVDLITEGITETMRSMAMDGEISDFEGVSVNETTALIRITQEKFEELVEASALLDALKAAGVDSWDGYEYAHELLNEGE